MASFGVDVALIRNISIKVNDARDRCSAVSAAIRNMKPLLIDNADLKKYPKLKKLLNNREIGSVYVLPIIVENNVEGVFALCSSKQSVFTSEACAILEEMTEDLAFGIQSLRIRHSHEEAQKTIRRLAFFDSVTKLPNHVKMENVLNGALSSSESTHVQSALLIIGINRFRDINTTLGFDAGNHVLSQIAARLKKSVSNNEKLFRVRGDEFAVFIEGATAEIAGEKASEIQKMLASQFNMEGFSLSMFASIGIVLIPDHGESVDKLLPHADVALQHAKQTGKPYEFYTPSLDSDTEYYLKLASKLYRAIECDQLELYYQPKISMVSGKVCGFEALARWFPPNERMIPPDTFIGLAEKTGMITPISYWVIESALRQSCLWRQSNINLPIAINLSARNLHDARLLDYIKERSVAWELKAGMLEVEITENAIMEDRNVAFAILSGIRDLGIPIYIDDFGSGQSSLQILGELPISALKIDKSFVIGMMENNANAIVRAAINLAKEMGLGVVAEGIENEMVWTQLMELDCDYGQGYYMGKPMSAGEVVTWLGTSRFGNVS
ncbi:bifunctional diguanylate cyclase/phosphodiesterase [Porticoccus sp.]